MNAPERKIVHLATCLLVLGLTVRILPWGLPSIETFKVGDEIIVAAAPAKEPPQVEKKADFPKKEDKAQVKEERDSLENVAVKVSKNDTAIIKKEELSKVETQPKKEKPKKEKPKVKLPLHINKASAADLCALNGVGPKLAEKIIEHRNAAGTFKNAKDLEKVPGIGKKKLEGILPDVIFD